MTFRVVGANNRRTRVELEMPFTETGEWAFDDDNNPIDGRIPVTIILPRFDCLPIEDIVAMQAVINNIETDGQKTPQENSRDITLSMLKPHVSASVFKLLSKRTMFELQQISEEWSAKSTMSPGELLASNGSSKNTRGQ